ncbi:hypothetical protein ACWNYQ_00110 [Candidatus Vidania fulgoroideorum]
MHSCGNIFIIYKNFKSYNKKFLYIFKNKLNLFYDQFIFLNGYFNKTFYVKIYNNNGTEAKNCLNGLRCLSRFIFKKLKLRKIKISILSIIFNFYIKKNNVITLINNISDSLKINKFCFKYKSLLLKNNKDLLCLNFFYKDIRFYNLNIGNKHLIVKEKIDYYSFFINSKKIIKKINITEFNNYNRFILTKENEVGYTNSCGSASSCLLYLYYINYKIIFFYIFNNYGRIGYFKKNFFYISSKCHFMGITNIKI